MKTRIPIIIGAGVCALLLTAPSGFSHGALTPPGPPAPTMLSLAQIEPRTPISSAAFVIKNPGSYYLTTNIVGVAGSNGITISSGNVTLDLDSTSGGSLTVSNCDLSNNAGSGIYFDGSGGTATIPATITGCSICSNSGSGLYIYEFDTSLNKVKQRK